jgi:hypothetical protein
VPALSGLVLDLFSQMRLVLQKLIKKLSELPDSMIMFEQSFSP